MTKPRTFSGIQPSGDIHLGNYLGAVKRWVDDQDKYDNIYCVVDLHAMTDPFDANELRGRQRELYTVLLAAGLDPKRSILFIQSHVRAHTELSWILNCVTPMGWLERMTAYKDAVAKQREGERVSTGLFDYPVLMAADIILYDASIVPVGDDQKQHVELARDIAQRFNRLFGETFVVPQPHILPEGARIMSLVDPSDKMSKSDEAPNATIKLLDEPDVIRRKIARATTDSGRDVRFDPTRQGIFNLLTIYQVLSRERPTAIEAKFEGKGYGDFKKELAEVVVEALDPIRRRYQDLVADRAYVDGVIADGAARAAAIAEPKLAQVKQAVGLT